MRVRFADCVLDADTRELFRGDEPVHLPPTGFRLLELLLENRPRAVAKAEIHEKIWPGTFVSEATLASAISDIRAAIGENGPGFTFIRTVHGFGYAFRGDVIPAERAPAILGAGCYLVFQDKMIELSSGENVLGRETGVTIRINDDSISRRHARIIVGGDSATLEDLGSKNGTFVGKTIVGSPRPLADGDQLRVGDVMMMFRLVSDADSTRTIGDSRLAQARNKPRPRKHLE